MPRRRGRLLPALVFAALAVAAAMLGFACGLDATGQLNPIAPLEAGPPVEASLPPKPDAAPNDAGKDAGPPTPCPTGLEGPVLIAIGADGGDFCIDATEVTNGQYDRFLNASDGGSVEAGVPDGGLPASCFPRSAGFERQGPSTASAAHPVTLIDWCSAYAYCIWAGKHLCASNTEWDTACTRDGLLVYPYGNDGGTGSCNANFVASAPAPVKTYPCQGGYDGIYDMVGNVTEWTASCGMTTCTARGGSYDTFGASCTTSNPLTRLATGPRTGFRCCY